MKKIMLMAVTIVMVTVFAFAFTGCGDGDDADVQATAQTEATAQSEETENGSGDPAVVNASELAGNYQDSVSQRATMTIEYDTDDNEIEISIIWSDSSDMSTEWDMDAVLQDNRLVYNSCEKEVTSYDANGRETAEEEAEQGSGYFEIDEQGRILWTGAADSECRECTFEKMTP